MFKLSLFGIFVFICSYVAYMSNFKLKYNYTKTQCQIQNLGISLVRNYNNHDNQNIKYYDGSVMYIHGNYYKWITVIYSNTNQLYISNYLRENYPIGKNVTCYYNSLNLHDILIE